MDFTDFTDWWTNTLAWWRDETDISDEKMEEYRMLSAFKEKEISRLRRFYLGQTGGVERMSKGLFMRIENISENILLDRICVCFGFTATKTSLTFEEFLSGLASFNSPGLKEQQLRIAFRIQDFDDDGIISKEDLTEYLKRITDTNLEAEKLNEIVDEVMAETASDGEQISFADFKRVVAPRDFQAKLLLPI